MSAATGNFAPSVFSDSKYSSSRRATVSGAQSWKFTLSISRPRVPLTRRAALAAFRREFLDFQRDLGKIRLDNLDCAF